MLAAILPAGMRAISTRIKEETGVGRLILPNDHVDVILTRRTRGRNGGEDFCRDTLFRNVRVLAIGQLIEAKEGKKLAEGNTATLELTPRQSELPGASEFDGRDLAVAAQHRRHGHQGRTDVQDKRGNSIRDLQVRSEVAGVWRQLSLSARTSNQGRQEGWQTMRMISRRMAGALLLAVVGGLALRPTLADRADGRIRRTISQHSVLHASRPRQLSARQAGLRSGWQVPAGAVSLRAQGRAGLRS